MAKLDLDRARRIASTVAVPYWRVRALAAPALAVGGEAARRVLQDAVADPELKAIMPQTNPLRTPETVAIALASILPLAEGTDPSFGRELLWRALSLRPPRPTVGLLDDEASRADVALAQLIARYEPAIARALLEPAVERLPQLASPAEPTQKAMPVVVAAAYVDPNWAVEALDRLPDPPDVSWARHAKNATRMFLVRALALQGNESWKHAGFWAPEK